MNSQCLPIHVSVIVDVEGESEESGVEAGIDGAEASEDESEVNDHESEVTEVRSEFEEPYAEVFGDDAEVVEVDSEFGEFGEFGEFEAEICEYGSVTEAILTIKEIKEANIALEIVIKLHKKRSRYGFINYILPATQTKSKALTKTFIFCRLDQLKMKEKESVKRCNCSQATKLSVKFQEKAIN